MIDEALLLRNVAELENYLGQVKEYDGIALEQYVRDWKTQRIVERTLQMMIETCVDIAGHVISDRGYRVPTSYAETFRILHEENVLGEELCKIMENMAKFRNIVVHSYDKIDAKIVVEILRNHLDDFLKYSNAIIAFLKRADEV
jgi:uncharacterized protein YutE (UPF0331/DUF86 family)